MEKELCVYCQGDLEKATYRVTEPRLNYDKNTTGTECSRCRVIVLDDSEAVAIIRAGQSSDKLSLDAFKLLIVCLTYVDYHFYVYKSDRLAREDDLMDLLNFDRNYIRVLLEELWRKRLVMTVKANNRPLYIVNGYKLGVENDYEEFVSRNFFCRDFSVKNNKSKESSKRRQLRKENLFDDFTDEERDSVLSIFSNKCALTGKEVPLQLDHVIPLAVGHGGTTKSNMLPIWQRINSSKGSKNIFEWYKVSGESFGVCPEMFKRAIEYLAELNEMTAEGYHNMCTTATQILTILRGVSN